MTWIRPLVSTSALRLPIRQGPAGITPRTMMRETMLNVKNICQQVVAFEVGRDRVLFFFTWSGRPTWDHLALALVDVKAMRVLDVKNDGGTIKGEAGPLVLRRVDDGSYEMRLVRETLADSGCDCAESDIEEWMRISVKNDRIVTHWTR